MEWKSLSDEHHAIAQTAFAKLIVDVDHPHTRKADALRYDARVEVGAEPLASQDDLPSMEEAKAWAEREYVFLLHAELARVGG